MKFRVLLWALGLLMGRASKNNPKFREQLEGKDLSFQLTSKDGVARHYIVHDNSVKSGKGKVDEPAFELAFSSSQKGFETLTATNAQLAFMTGIQNGDIKISGNPGLVMWFQKLVSVMMKKKNKG